MAANLHINFGNHSADHSVFLTWVQSMNCVVRDLKAKTNVLTLDLLISFHLKQKQTAKQKKEENIRTLCEVPFQLQYKVRWEHLFAINAA